MKVTSLLINNFRSKRWQAPWGERGFTLLEVLVAGFILTIGLLGIAGMMTSAVRGNDFGKRMTTAEHLAQERLEEFKTLSYTFSKQLSYNSNGVKKGPGLLPPGINIACGTNADGASDIDDDLDDGADEYEAYELEDYGVIADLQNVNIKYPHYRRETLVEAAGGCAPPTTDQTANVTVVVKWKGVTGEHSVQFMSMLAK